MLITLLITCPIVIFIIIAFALFIRKKIKEQRALRKTKFAIFEELCITTIFYLWNIFTIPFQFLKAVFFVFDGGTRIRFSLTRTLFALSAFLMLFRMLVGGAKIDSINAGPQIEVTKAQKRAWLSVRKIETKQVSLYELLLFLIFAGLYYFRKDLHRGDQRGFLDKLVVLIGEAYAIRIASQNQNRSSFTEITTQANKPTPQNFEKDFEERNREIKEENPLKPT